MLTRIAKRRRAFLTADAAIALAVLVILAGALTVAIAHQKRAAQTLGQTRAAARLAKPTLVALQTGEKPPAVESATVRVEPSSAEAPQGFTWVRVSVSLNGRSAELTGLARADRAKGVTP